MTRNDSRTAPPAPAPTWTRVTAALVLGAGIAVALVGLGRALTPEYRALNGFGFSDNLTFKSWLATGVLLLAAGQLLTALWMYGRLPLVQRRPSWLSRTHRSLGATAFLLSLPVAFCCLYAYGFAPAPMTTRTLVHSVLGCLFYGTFAVKVTAVRSRRTPSWALPVLGGVLVTLVVLMWMTSALWFFRTTGVHT
ncbi:MAG TPA: DUF6529 family protein [Mycobacteriales bacterium]|nr:DUF6529 family protein [Mycobacteriales bacterium]